MDILGKIRRLQKERGWSEYQLSKEAKLAQSTISGLYRKNNLPSLPTLEALCRAFGITLSQFFVEGNLPVDLTEEQQQMLCAWGALTPEQKESIFHLLKAMQ